MSVDNTKVAAVWPGTETYDTLIYADTWNIGINNAAFAFSTSWDPKVSFGCLNDNFQGLPVAIYSIDAGVTWYDANGNDGPIKFNVGSNADGTVYTSWVGTGSPAFLSVILKVGILSISQSETLAVPIGGGAVLSFNTQVNYQKISTTTEASTGTGSTVIAHGAGRIPTYRVWRRDTTGRILNFGTEAFSLDSGVYADATNVTLISWLNSLHAASVYPGQNWIVRAYKDD